MRWYPCERFGACGSERLIFIFPSLATTMSNLATPRTPLKNILNLKRTNGKLKSVRRKLKDYKNYELFPKAFSNPKWESYMLCDKSTLTQDNNTVLHVPCTMPHHDVSIPVVTQRLQFNETESPNHVHGSFCIVEPPTPSDVLNLVTSNIIELSTCVAVGYVRVSCHPSFPIRSTLRE